MLLGDHSLLTSPSTARLVAVLRALAGLGAAAVCTAAATSAMSPEELLGQIRPDYAAYIGRVRPLADQVPDRTGQHIYMALVRPGGGDPLSPFCAPFVGPGARNDILYATESIRGEHSNAWAMLLLDHEYFHARHLAGATSLPLPGRVAPEVERHFYEAAAWGFNVAEARSGRYPGLRPEEFREALDRYGEHYAALRDLTRASRPVVWAAYSDGLRHPSLAVTTSGSPRARVPARPSGWDRSPAIP